MIRNENGLLAGYVYVDIGRERHRRLRGARQGRRWRPGSTLKPGYSLEWSGQYENMLRVRERLKVVVPITDLHDLLPALHEHAAPRSRPGS